MTWTRERPTREGWYWVKGCIGYSGTAIAHIDRVGAHSLALVVRIGAQMGKMIDVPEYRDLFWAGPLEPPQENP